MNPACALCRFWDRSMSKDGDDGMCRRFPPPMSDPSYAYDAFPVTRPTDWCGEFRPDITQADADKETP